MVPQPPRPHPVALVLAGLAALVGLATVVLYAVPTLQGVRQSVALASAFLPYGVIAWLVSLAVLLASTRGRHRWLVAPVLLGLLANAVPIAACYDPSHTAPEGTEPTVRIVTLNMRYGQADLHQLLDELRTVQPDLVVLVEFTSQASAVLTDPEWTQLLPYHLGTTGQPVRADGSADSSGTQVLSRSPLVELGSTPQTRATTLAVRATVGGRTLTLVAAHPANSIAAGLAGWLDESSQVTELSRRYSGGPLVVAGDLNSVSEHVTVRNLLAATGLHECITGWQPTFPADRRFPLVRIDHVLASADFRTVSTSTFAASGSDHLGVVAELAYS